MNEYHIHYTGLLGEARRVDRVVAASIEDAMDIGLQNAKDTEQVISVLTIGFSE